MQSMNIGKNGITKELVSEIKLRLKKHKTLRIKILKSALADRDKKEIAKEVSEKVNGKVRKVKGNTFFLEKDGE